MDPSDLPANTTGYGVKAKRRRTSPQDHAVLETAYLKNSKPDKIQRVQIVSQVSLGEKEVQIWFQNRRQNDRRRSKPLGPDELAAHLLNNTASSAPPPRSSSPPSEGSFAADLCPGVSLSIVEPVNRPASRASSIQDLLNPTTPSQETSPKHSTQETSDNTTPSSSFEDNAACETKDATAAEPENEKPENAEALSAASSEQGSAKKRNYDEMAGAKVPSIGRPIETGGKTEDISRSKEPLARTSSFVRLAMTVDGAVKVRTRQEDTPSPEKPRATPPAAQNKAKTPMIRSKSATTGVEVFRDSVQGVRRRAVAAGFGRSRDARTWEFYCDSNSKDALSTQAEAETAGSAVSAINLIRSNSFKSRSQALSPSLAKTNTRPMSSEEGKSKLSRAKSSLGRLQGLDALAKPVDGKSNSHLGHVRSPSGDSDKENWAPGTRMSEHALRRSQPSGSQRPILQENEEMTFPDASSSRKGRNDEAFSQPSPTKEKAKGEEMDCIQGLLSLSQGAWTMKQPVN